MLPSLGSSARDMGLGIIKCYVVNISSYVVFCTYCLGVCMVLGSGTVMGNPVNIGAWWECGRVARFPHLQVSCHRCVVCKA